MSERDESGMRHAVIMDLKRSMGSIIETAERDEARAKDPGVRPSLVKYLRDQARYSRRQAAHYQQAIDLLSAAPMPERSEEP
jgi:hypothetical protein